MSPKIIFSMIGVGKIVPPKQTILNNIHLSFFYGAKIGVLGLNGSGKSTLLRIIAGEDKDYVGEITHQKGLRFGYLPQEPRFLPGQTVREVVEEGVAETKKLLTDFDALSMQMAEPMDDKAMNQLLEQQGKLQDAIEAADAWDLERQLELAADALRLPDWDAVMDHLSGGEQRRVALCRLLLQAPDVLLLDEPTNHLDAESVAWLERYLHEFKGTVIAVTHDRYFLDNVAGWILELDRGRGLPFEGNYSHWLIQKEKRLHQESREEARHQREMASELEWVRSNPSGRRKKSQARLNQFEELASKEFQKRQETLSLYIPPGPRLGEQVIQFKDVAKALGDKLLYEGLSFAVPRGAIVGIIGPNGAGKTTLFRLITREEQPDSGEVVVGDTVHLGYVNQSRDALDGDKTVWEEISDGLDIIQVGNFEMPSRSYVGRFNFKGSQQQKFVKELSGGERNRLHLAKLLRQGHNTLLLDEPTNDLDIETLRALEEAILGFAGSIMVISHDRWFLDRVATHLLVFEGDSTVTWFEGNYTEYEQRKKQLLGDDALQPHRIRYKPLTHTS